MPWWGWLLSILAVVLVLWWIIVGVFFVKVWRKIDTESDDFDNRRNPW